MTHASWNNEKGLPSGPGHDNERLEYLGDAVLELVAGEYLFRRFPGYDEGQLTQLRAALVNTVSLARFAEGLGLGDALLLGRGAAKTGARQLPSLLANSFEAMIGAVFLDQGYRVATRIFLQNIGDLADWTDENHKGRLQEVAQDRLGATPTYRVAASGGHGHRREYTAEATVAGTSIATGRGRTKQAAEQAAARAALEKLASDTSPSPPAVAAAAGAARQAASRASTEGPRVRRRVAEVAADRTGGPRRPPSAGTIATTASAPSAGAPPRRRGLLGALRAAAEALVGRGDPEVAPPPPATDSPPTTPAATSRRRGRRGGRGRSGRPPAAPSSSPAQQSEDHPDPGPKDNVRVVRARSRPRR